jgi:NitT/TauT family transport system substrate-binding protein
MRRTSFLVGAASALTAIRPTRGLAQQTKLVRVATTPIGAGAQPYFAKAVGIFAREGIDTQIMTLSTGAAVAAAVASGSVDVGQSNVVSIAVAHQKGLPFGLIAPGNLFVSRIHQSALVVPEQSALRTARDLTGKTIAINGLRTITDVGVDAWLDRNGGSSSSVHYLEMPFSAMGAAVAAGRVDAAFISEPQLDAAVQAHRLRIIGYPYDAIADQFLLGGWFCTQAWSKEHPDLVRAYAAAMEATSRWANANQPQSAKILQQETGVTVPAGMPRVLFGEQLKAEQIQPVIDVAAKYGVLRRAFPANDIVLASL